MLADAGFGPHDALMTASRVPADFKQALEAARLADFFADCTASHQREYLKWVGEAKRPETRKTRIEKAMQHIAAKRAEEMARAKVKSSSRKG